MPSIARSVHELRVPSENGNWRIVYRLDPDAVVILDVFKKQSRETPRSVIQACRRRLTAYDSST
jgi:phage-related protein